MTPENTNGRSPGATVGGARRYHRVHLAGPRRAPCYCRSGRYPCPSNRLPAHCPASRPGCWFSPNRVSDPCHSRCHEVSCQRVPSRYLKTKGDWECATDTRAGLGKLVSGLCKKDFERELPRKNFRVEETYAISRDSLKMAQADGLRTYVTTPVKRCGAEVRGGPLAVLAPTATTAASPAASAAAPATPPATPAALRTTVARASSITDTSHVHNFVGYGILPRGIPRKGWQDSADFTQNPPYQPFTPTFLYE